MSKPVRVLEVFHGMDCGGAENMIMNLYREIDRSKIQLDFLVHTRDRCFFDNEIELLGGNIYRVPYYKGKNYLSYKHALEEFFSTHPEISIVHGHLGSCANIYLSVAKRFGKYTIAHSHNTKPKPSIKNLIYRFNTLQVRRIADFFIGCSDAAGLYRYGKRIVDNSGKYTTLYNAINTDSFLYNSAIRQKIRSEFGISDEIVLGHVGRFNEQKNHEYLIRIMEEIVKITPSAKLLLVGDGNLKERITNLVKEKNLENNVIFTGLRHDVNNILQGMDCFVFPSLFEGLPVTVVEAQAASLPCVISDKITQEVKLTENVYFQSIEQDASEWVDPILELSQTSARINRKKEIVESGYDIAATANWITNFYLKVAKNRT